MSDVNSPDLQKPGQEDPREAPPPTDGLGIDAGFKLDKNFEGEPTWFKDARNPLNQPGEYFDTLLGLPQDFNYEQEGVYAHSMIREQASGTFEGQRLVISRIEHGSPAGTLDGKDLDAEAAKEMWDKLGPKARAHGVFQEATRRLVDGVRGEYEPALEDSRHLEKLARNLQTLKEQKATNIRSLLEAQLEAIDGSKHTEVTDTSPDGDEQTPTDTATETSEKDKTLEAQLEAIDGSKHTEVTDTSPDGDEQTPTDTATETSEKDKTLEADDRIFLEEVIGQIVDLETGEFESLSSLMDSADDSIDNYRNPKHAAFYTLRGLSRFDMQKMPHEEVMKQLEAFKHRRELLGRLLGIDPDKKMAWGNRIYGYTDFEVFETVLPDITLIHHKARNDDYSDQPRTEIARNSRYSQHPKFK